MDYTIYEFSLFIALPLMLFFGFYFLLAKIHFRKLSALPSDHRDSVAAACRQLFGAFLFRNPVQERQCGHSDEPFDLLPVLLAFQFGTHDIAGPLLHHKAPVTDAYQPLGHFFRPFLHRADVVARQTIALFALAAWLVTYGFVLARRLILAYNRAIRIFNETYSDDIGAYIKWLSIFTWWAVIFGVGCGLLTFLPDKYVYIWILSSIPFYGYLFYSYQNYMIFYEQVERTLEIENAADDEKKKTETEKESPKYFDGIESSLTPWLENKSYTQSGFTIQDMAKTLGTNRTYLNAYIKDKYHVM